MLLVLGTEGARVGHVAARLVQAVGSALAQLLVYLGKENLHICDSVSCANAAFLFYF